MFWKGWRQSQDIVPIFLLTSVSGKKILPPCLFSMSAAFSLFLSSLLMSLKLTCEVQKGWTFWGGWGWRSSALAADWGHHFPLGTGLPVKLCSFFFCHPCWVCLAFHILVWGKVKRIHNPSFHLVTPLPVAYGTFSFHWPKGKKYPPVMTLFARLYFSSLFLSPTALTTHCYLSGLLPPC